MRILQIVLPGASAYERKCQRIDLAMLAGDHDVILTSAENARGVEADIAHVYTSTVADLHAFGVLPMPHVSAVDVAQRRWSLGRRVAPRLVLSPLPGSAEDDRHRTLPEAVEETYWSRLESAGLTLESDIKVVGSFVRPVVENVVGQTLARLERFRSDVTWRRFHQPPTPADLVSIDLWVDPAIGGADFDGFVAEALVAGRPVVAARTPINTLRLEKGRIGLLVPPGDPNEMTHAILAALFKPEIVSHRSQAARQTITRFRPSRRLQALLQAYQALTT